MNSRDLPVLTVSTPGAPVPYAAIPQQYTHPGLSLSQLFSIAAAYWRVTLATVLAFVGLTALVSLLMPKTYEASATLMVDYNVTDPIAGKEFPVGLMANYMSTQTQLITSPAVLMPVIERLQLTKNKRYTSGFKGDPANLAEYVRGRMVKKLTVEQGEWGSQLIHVTFAAPTAKEAADVANAVADVYADQQALRLAGPSDERTRRYTDQLDELKRRVDEAQTQLTAFMQKNGLIDNETKVDLELEKLAELQHRLLEAQNQRRILEAQSMGNNATRDQVLASTSVQGLKTQLATLQARMAELSATLGPRHPEVMQLRSQIESTRRALNAELSVYSSNAESSLSSARRLEEQLLAAVEEMRATVQKKRAVQDAAAKYQLELETAQTLYKQALDNYDQIVIASGGGYNNVRFVGRALPPSQPDKPKILLNIALAFVIGSFFGVVGPLLYELLHRRVRCRDDLDRDFGLPVLAEFNSLTAHVGAK